VWLGFELTTMWALAFWVLCRVAAGGSAPLDGLVEVEKIGLAPRGRTGTKIPLWIGATAGPPSPPLPGKAVPMIVWGAKILP